MGKQQKKSGNKKRGAVAKEKKIKLRAEKVAVEKVFAV